MKAAFFDFDGTMRPGDSILHYMLYALKKHRMAVSDVFAALLAGLLYALRLIPPETLKTRFLQFEKRMDPASQKTFAEAFVREILLPTMYPEAADTWQKYREDGCLTVLVSASTEDYMRSLSDALRADDLICTGIKEHRVLTNCRGEEKARRIRAWANHRRVPLQECVSLGNSSGDLEMLALTGRAVVINPGRKMAAAAKEKGYSIRTWKKKA